MILTLNYQHTPVVTDQNTPRLSPAMAHTPQGSTGEADEVNGWDGVGMWAEPDGADMDGPNSREVHMERTPQGPSSDIPPNDTAYLPSSDFEGCGVHPPDLVLKRKRSCDPDVEKKPPCKMEKRRRADEVETETDDDKSCEERGESRSAAASRKLKEALKSGRFVVDERKRTVFEEKCKQMSNGAKFRYGEKWEVLHQKCGKWSTMTEPYNTTRFRTHVGTCKSKDSKGQNGCIDDFFRPQAKSAGTGALVESAKQPTATARKQVVVGGRSIKSDLGTPPVIAGSRPCLGLRDIHNNRIPRYISRALTEGAGSQSDSRVTARLFGEGTKYSELSDQSKQLVKAAQVHSREWMINRELQAIYSTNCRKTINTKSTESACSQCLGVLRLEAFKKALKVEPAPLASKKYIPHRWRTAATDLAINLADIKGLPGLLEAVSLSSPTSFLSMVDWKSCRTLTNPNGSHLFRMSLQANTWTRSCC